MATFCCVTESNAALQDKTQRLEYKATGINLLDHNNSFKVKNLRGIIIFKSNNMENHLITDLRFIHYAIVDRPRYNTIADNENGNTPSFRYLNVLL